MDEPGEAPQESTPSASEIPVSAPEPAPPPVVPGAEPQPAAQAGPANETSKILSALGYPIWPVALVAILIEPYKNEPFVRSHAYQALGLNLGVWAVVWLLGATVVGVALSGIVGVAALVYEIVLAVKAFNGEYVEVPLVHGVVKGMIEGR